MIAALEELPDRRQPTRLPAPNYFATYAAALSTAHLNQSIVLPGLSDRSHRSGRTWDARQDDTGSGITIRYIGLNLRAYESINLEQVPIRVPAGVMTIAAKWLATGTNVDGRDDGILRSPS